MSRAGGGVGSINACPREVSMYNISLSKGDVTK